MPSTWKTPALRSFVRAAWRRPPPVPPFLFSFCFSSFECHVRAASDLYFFSVVIFLFCFPNIPKNHDSRRDSPDSHVAGFLLADGSFLTNRRQRVYLRAMSRGSAPSPLAVGIVQVQTNRTEKRRFLCDMVGQKVSTFRRGSSLLVSGT